jgi:uncharacterized HhH-GPD family protein
MKANNPPSTLLDYGTLQGGLVRMMERFREEGTLTGDADADTFVRTYPNAVLLGMLYDQRVRAEYAFTGPQRLHERIGSLEMKKIAEMDEEKLREVFAIKPAVHRFTNKMADMTGALARVIIDEYDGDVSKLWNDGADFPVIEKRLRALPGFGPQKAYKMKYALHYFGYRDFS